MAFENLNLCASFNLVANSSGLTRLSSFSCSEVIITNPSNATLLVYDNNNFSDTRALGVLSGNTIAVRGVTSSDSLSAKFLTAPAAGTIYCRAQYYSHSTVSYG